MDSSEYKKQVNQRTILSYNTLVIALKELQAHNRGHLANEIERILKDNQIKKPNLHLKPNDQDTNFYKVDLTFEQIEEIRDIYLFLEASFVSDKGETTTLAAYYASLCDEWNGLIDTIEK